MRSARAARYAAQHLNDDGTAILIEPSASDERSENMNTIGKCIIRFLQWAACQRPNAEVGLALGAAAAEKAHRHNERGRFFAP